MPFKKNRKRRFRKKNYNKKYNDFDKSLMGKTPSSVINKGIGVPDRFYTSLAISNMRQIVTGTLGEWYYEINNLYDPYHSMLATQPMYYDQLTAMYKRYRVHGLWLNIQFQNHLATQPVRLVMWPDTNTSTVYTIEEARQKKGARYLLLGRNTSGGGLKAFTKYINFRKYFGKEIDENDYSGTGGPPVRKMYLRIASQNADDGIAAIKVNIHTYFRFYCVFYERQQVLQS